MVVRGPLRRNRVSSIRRHRASGGHAMGQGGSWSRRTVLAAAGAVLLTAWAVVGGGAGAASAEGEASSLVDATNLSRQRLAGADSVARAADLDAVAQRHAEAMAARGGLFHNPNLATDVEGWRVVAENVGRGMDIGAIHERFLESPSHRANVLDPRLTEL